MENDHIREVVKASPTARHLFDENTKQRATIEQLRTDIELYRTQLAECRTKNFDTQGQAWREYLRDSVNTHHERVMVKVDELLQALYRITILEARVRDLTRTIGLPEKMLNEVLHVVSTRKPSSALGHVGIDLASGPDRTAISVIPAVPHNDNAR